MYIYLNSNNNSGFHTNNKGTDFVVTLPTSYFFSRNESWQIGLIDIYMETEPPLIHRRSATDSTEQDETSREEEPTEVVNTSPNSPPSTGITSDDGENNTSMADISTRTPGNAVNSMESTDTINLSYSDLNTKLNSILLLCCDVVEPSVLNGTQLNILSSVRLKDCQEGVFQPGHVRYIPLTQERLCNVHLYLKDSAGNSVTVPNLVTHCTLHIRRRI